MSLYPALGLEYPALTFSERDQIEAITLKGKPTCDAQITLNALLRWWRKVISCNIKAMRLSTAPAPMAWKQRAARCDDSDLLNPAHKAQNVARKPQTNITGRRPKATEAGTRT